MPQLTASESAQLVAAVGAMVAAIVAVIAAIQSYRSSKQNNETNEQMIRPRVVVYVDNSKYDIAFIDLAVLNEGGGLARDIKFTVSGDDPPMSFSGGTDKTLSSFDVMESGIKILPARTSRNYFILSTIDQVDKILGLDTCIDVTYTDSTGTKAYKDTFNLDFISLPKMKFTDKVASSQQKLANETEKIRKALEKK